MKIVINETKNNEVKAILYRDNGVIEMEGPKISCLDDFMTGANVALNALRLDYDKRDLRDFLKTGIFGKLKGDFFNKYKYFVVVGDVLVYDTGGFDYIADLDKNLRFGPTDVDFGKTEIIEIYGDKVNSFNQARGLSESGICEFVWKRDA